MDAEAPRRLDDDAWLGVQGEGDGMVSVPWSPCRAWIHGWVHDSRRFRARGTKEDRGRIAVAGGPKGMKKRDKGAKKSAYPSPRPETDCWADAGLMMMRSAISTHPEPARPVRFWHFEHLGILGHFYRVSLFSSI